MSTTEDDTFPGQGDEPPFLQEPTVFVRQSHERTWNDRLSDFLDSRRPPMMIFGVAAVIALAGLIYLARPEPEPVADPLLSAAGPVATEEEQEEDLVPPSSDGADLTPATVEPDTSPQSTDPPTTQAPQTTAAPTTATTEESTTTTVESTTTTEETTTTTVETTTTTAVELEECFVRIRRSDVYAEPSDDNDEIGDVPAGTYLALAFTEANDGWVLIDAGDLTGWIEADRVRGTEGDCT